MSDEPVVKGREIGEEAVEEHEGPGADSIRDHMLVQLQVLVLALVDRHLEGFVDRPGNAHQIPRVDVNGAGQSARGTGEFGQNQGTVVTLLADNILETRGVHAVTEGCDYTKVSDAEKGIELVLLNRLVAK